MGRESERCCQHPPFVFKRWHGTGRGSAKASTILQSWAISRESRNTFQLVMVTVHSLGSDLLRPSQTLARGFMI